MRTGRCSSKTSVAESAVTAPSHPGTSCGVQAESARPARAPDQNDQRAAGGRTREVADAVRGSGYGRGGSRLFVCGEDADAREQVTALLGEGGWPAHRGVDLGGIPLARALGVYLPLWLDPFQKLGPPNFNGVLRRAH